MSKQYGFTLIELIIVIVLIGIVSVTLGNLYTQSILSFLNLSNSITVVDNADLIQRRFFRDIRNALPNSIRITSSGSKIFLEYIPIKTSGKYKAMPNSSASSNPCGTDDLSETDNDILSFGKPETCFKTVGNIIDASLINTNDFLVIYNVGNAETNADAYAGGNRSSITNATDLLNETKLQFSTKTFTYDSLGNIFYIVSQPVTYECDSTAHTLKKYINYGFNSVQNTTYSNGYLISNNISSCTWTYNNLINMQKGILTFKLGMLLDTVSIMLINSVSVGNVP